MTLKLLSTLTLLVFAVNGYAKAQINSAFPLQCRVSGLKYAQGEVILYSQHTAKPRLYAIHNTSHHALWIVHESKHAGMGAGWDTPLSPNHWSALLMTRRNFTLNCQLQKKSGKAKSAACHSVVQVCQFSNVYSKNPLNGGYWAVENVPYSALIPRITQRGLVVK